MVDIHIVTGFHRAGTHAKAQDLSTALTLPWIDEAVIDDDNWSALVNLCNTRNRQLKQGFIIQCPMLSHKVQDMLTVLNGTTVSNGTLAVKVYWCDRIDTDMIASMRNIGFKSMAWRVVAHYKQQFAQDAVWSNVSYTVSDDPDYQCVGYYALMIKIKRYFYSKFFASLAGVTHVQLEDQAYNDINASSAYRLPLNQILVDRVSQYNSMVTI